MPKDIPSSIHAYMRLLTFLNKALKRGYLIDKDKPWPRYVEKAVFFEAVIQNTTGSPISVTGLTKAHRDLFKDFLKRPDGQLTLRQGGGRRPYVYFLPFSNEIELAVSRKKQKVVSEGTVGVEVGAVERAAPLAEHGSLTETTVANRSGTSP